MAIAPPTTGLACPAGSSASHGPAGSVEDDDLAQAVAGAQPVEGALEVVEGEPAVDEPLDRESAGEVERGVAREVDRRVGEPVVRAEDPPAAVDERVDRERRPRRRAASSRRGPRSRRAAAPRSRARRSPAGRSPRTRSRDRRRSGRAAPRWSPPRSSVASRRVGRAEGPRHVELGLDPVDRHDPRRRRPARRPSRTTARRRPSPMTATLAPAGTAAVLRTAPTPVVTQQPMSAATAGSTPSGRAIAAASGTTVAPAIVPIPQYDSTGFAVAVGQDRGAVGHPVAERRGVGAGPRPAGARTRGRRRTGRATTARPAGRPTATATPGPTASTTPAPSWPIAIGVGRGQSPSRTWRSEWQTPDARILTRTSPARGSARSSSSTVDRLRRRSAAPRPGSRSRLGRPPSLDGACRHGTGRRPATTSRRRRWPRGRPRARSRRPRRAPPRPPPRARSRG